MASDTPSIMAQSVRTGGSLFSSSNGYVSPSHYSAITNGDDYDNEGSNFAEPTRLTLSNSVPAELAGAIPLIDKLRFFLVMVKFESGYTVETVFDGSKLGIEPYFVEVTPSGELLVLDSQNSNIHKISTPLSKYSVPKFVAGSSEGYSGHLDGKHRESRINHPTGLAVDEKGNLYVADTKNMAIRKISDTCNLI